MGLPSSLIELWIEYAIGMSVFFLRFFARWKAVGWKIAWDDFFCAIAMVLYTCDAALVFVITKYGAIPSLDADSIWALTEQQIEDYTTGSKALFAVWLCYVTLIFSIKANLLCFYLRLTLGLWQEKFVKVMAVVCVLFYIGVVLEMLTHCMPVYKNWQVTLCGVGTPNYFIIVFTNVLSDIAILGIPLPLICTVNLPLRRKIIIGLLCSGIFIITAAIPPCVLSLIEPKNLPNSTSWGMRETFVSVIAICSPVIKPLFNNVGWRGSSLGKERQKACSDAVDGFVGFDGLVKRGDKNPVPGGNDTLATLDLEVGDIGADWELKEVESGDGSEKSILGKDRPAALAREHSLKINVTTGYTLGS